MNAATAAAETGSSAAPTGRVSILAGPMRWLDCLIEREVLRLRARYELSMDELRGLYISDEQVDQLIRARVGTERAPDPSAMLSARAHQLAPDFGPSSLLYILTIRLRLCPADLDILLLALAPEIDPRYETLFAYLNNDITRKYLTVDLALRLLSAARTADMGATLGHRNLFTSTAPLIASGALEPVESPDRRSSLLRGYVVAPLIAQLLTDQPLVDARWPKDVRWLPPVGLDTVAESSRRALEPAGGVPLTVIVGDDSSERLRCACAWSQLRAMPLLYVPLASMASEAPYINTIMLAARLAGGGIALDDDLTPEIADPTRAVSLIHRLALEGIPTVLLSHGATRWMRHLMDLPLVRIDVAPPTVAERARLWRRCIDINEQCAQSLAQRFAMGTARIAAAARSAAAQMAATDSDDESGAPEPDRLSRLLSAQASQRANDALTRLAVHVRCPHSWSQLVLAETTLKQLRDVASAMSHRHRVYLDWGMLQRTGRSSGLMVLFSGASGTGKTMAASVLANDTRLDLYRIDIATVVSKYIGETEQNLDRVFNAARGASAILMFDEADALLGKRSEVKDAHDRYANLEVAYLLQKMEEHDGVVILASNLAKNLDSAFARRMHYTIEFARPNARLRESLWRGMFPAAVPLASDIDYRFLADKFETTGGEIQAIALDAAFLAAAESCPLGMNQLMRAMTRRQTMQGNPGGLARFEAHLTQLSATDASRVGAGR